MKVTLELDEDIIYAIAQKKGIENGYRRLSDPEVDGDLTAMYAAAFSDGMTYLLELFQKGESNE